MANFLNIKTNYKHCTLEHYIKKLDPAPEMSRSAVFERAVRAAEGADNWKKIQERLFNLKNEEGATAFSGMQIHFSDATASILETIKKDICEQCGLKVLQAQYMVQLLQVQYLETLERERISLKTENTTDEIDIGLPEMASIFVEMMLKEKDGEHLRQIRNILLDWRRKNESI